MSSYDAYRRPLEARSQATSLVDSATAGAIACRQPLRYASYTFDTVPRLHYLSERSYDPLTAQFLPHDPARDDGEENPYQYCGGDPIGKTDPSGEIAIWGDEGRITAFDTSVHAYTHTKNKKLRAHFWKRVVSEGRRERVRWRRIERQRERAWQARMRAWKRTRDRRREAQRAQARAQALVRASRIALGLAKLARDVTDTGGSLGSSLPGSVLSMRYDLTHADGGTDNTNHFGATARATTGLGGLYWAGYGAFLREGKKLLPWDPHTRAHTLADMNADTAGMIYGLRRAYGDPEAQDIDRGAQEYEQRNINSANHRYP